MFRRDSGSGIADSDNCHPIASTSFNSYFADILADRLRRIGQEVHPNLIELPGKTFNQRKVSVVSLERDAIRIEVLGEQTDRGLDACVNINSFEFRLVEAREGTQVQHDVANAARAFLTVFDNAAQLGQKRFITNLALDCIHFGTTIS